VSTGVSEEHIASIFRVEEMSSVRNHQARRWQVELISSTLKMEAICSSETSVETKQTTRRHIPEGDTLHDHRCLLRYNAVYDSESLLHAGFLLGFLFDSEDGGDMFLRRIC
jgi:hypothetical protein